MLCLKYTGTITCQSGLPRPSLLYHEVWNPGPPNPQIICNENHHLALFGSLKENQTCTELRVTISRHLLAPNSRWGKTVDSYRRSCKKIKASERKGGKGGRTKKWTVSGLKRQSDKWYLFHAFPGRKGGFLVLGLVALVVVLAWSVVPTPLKAQCGA